MENENTGDANGSGGSPAIRAAETGAVVETDRWQPLPPRAGTVYRLVGAIGGGLCSLFGGLVPVFISSWSPWLKLAAATVLVSAFIATGVRLGQRRWLNTAWRLDGQGMAVRRGKLFFSETLVPRSRVQHLDIERGPIERHYGLATLVVHTAGTRNHALRQSGLDEAQALALRDALLPQAKRDDDGP